MPGELLRLEEGMGRVLEGSKRLEDVAESGDKATDEVLGSEEKVAGAGCSCGCGYGGLSAPLRLGVGTTKDV